MGSSNYTEHKKKVHLWKYPSSGPPKKFTVTLSVGSIVVTVFFVWGHKGILLVNFLDHGDTVNAECYCGTHGRLWQSTSTCCERSGLLCQGIIIWHNIAWFHTAKDTSNW